MYQQSSACGTLRLLTAVVAPACAVAALLGAQQVPAEVPRPPQFEAASVRPNRSGSLSLEFQTPPGRLAVRNADLRTLIKNAFQIRQDVDLIGGPRWIETERFDITATAAEKASHDRILLMLQALLFERFKLAVHHEPRQAQVYKLRIASGAPKVRELKAGMTPRSAGPDTRLITILGKTSGLTRALSKFLGRDVIDETGLTGSYDLSIEVAKDDPIIAAGSADTGNRAGPAAPSLFSALQEQLGLKLVSEKAEVSILVIDHVERPSTN
jgi:uncharacterized protein (TIGR03435 family)